VTENKNEVKTGEIVAAGATALATQSGVPQDLVRDAGLGTEGITATDVRPPRLRFCQSGSPQRKRGDEKQIQGLDEGMMFNDLTQEIYGEGPVDFLVIKKLGERGIVYKPMEEGGGIIDRDVPVARDPRNPKRYLDERMNFQGDKKPVATRYVDYLVLLLSTPGAPEFVALSLKGSHLQVAVAIDSLMKNPVKVDGQLAINAPAWCRVFSLETRMKSEGPNTWVAAKLSQPRLATADERAMASGIYKSFLGAKIVIDAEEEQDEASFNHGANAAAGEEL
jgi:hypothetical protein